ncbi:3-oxoadipyl-CoA thiolase [Litchfieldella xinjiangensis]|uniref:3-oxoadipyl-CoA thiolase n=1 Tax=Litchfieldella xinjiangensis TaxID=1166948 RepID=UPI0005BA6B62|nr:3-oxoadipyl-CoA thiolase [Halomonas xinjiangensis]
MRDAYICAGTRTPIGRYGGSLAMVRPDDMASHVLRALMAQVPGLPAEAVEDVILGCANQAGEDNRNIARMAVLLSGLPETVPGTTVNRLCGSGMDAVGMAARAIRTGEAEVIVAGGVESMTRAPFVMGKATSAFSRQADIFDTTIGWRFVNPLIMAQYGIDSMPETAENVAADFGISREDQDNFALRSQQRAAIAQRSGRLGKEITPVDIPQRKGEPLQVSVDEHPRETTLEKLASLPTPFREGGSVTAGNASGVNDGAAALLIASPEAVVRYGLQPLARVRGMANVGVPPQHMGIGPAPASKKLLSHLGMTIGEIDIVELNEAFAAQALAVLRDLGLPDNAEHVNPNGGGIALGHPLGMSGTRLVLTAALELQEQSLDRALCTMCIGVGQGIAMVIERVK